MAEIPDEPAGFCMGLFMGFIFPFTLLVLCYSEEVKAFRTRDSFWGGMVCGMLLLAAIVIGSVYLFKHW